ncbi:SusC/RagA family TonB-linked outer membrane protein [Dyadobacter fanqingshengii]|uniref:SusC/RagA family TonB-linked outer membrane protein n=1 Tax=Dyadobacter fanqingshengii TaxID=2906443 RepID=A0A9X1P4M6_9BACT|nr:SusC/RagA family TonB-linked outer membrane protein [Dyadobacter fanqingshengii]MCF0038799.1 SusC/RagA family TonB-linked outer membrane protein [Dyadobacter fanqingshengii]USJ34373.1 SusC/RagA family TonB-linked outer membrane protein [Dyadobacter fanqingshengii]
MNKQLSRLIQEVACYLLCSVAMLLVLPGNVQAADRQITGTVVSAEDKNPLPGVTIIVKGNNTMGTATDTEGKFKMTVPEDATLILSYIGYTSQELVVGTQSDFTIEMASDQKQLSEVVVIGYGTQKKGDITSSVASIKREDFVKGTVRDAAQLIQGKVAGLRITTPSGSPTSNTQINLRGINSINGTSNPLILIDGIPGNLNTVAPEDIESVDVLKDGSAAAIYGTRATGGVILITTRKNRGNNSRSTVEYSNYVNIQTIARRPDLLTGDDYRQKISEGIDYTDYGGNTDWLKEIMQKPVSHNHNLTFFGGNSTTNFTGSVNYRNWEGIFLRSGQSRFTGRADLNHAMFNNKLKTNIQIINRITSSNGAVSPDNNDALYGYAYRQAMIRNPTDNVRTETGAWQERDGYFYENPVSLLNESNYEAKFKEMRMSGSLDYAPIADLNFKLLVSNVQNSNLAGGSTTFLHTATRLNNQNATAFRNTNANNENLLEFTGNYAKSFGKHRFTLLGGYSWQDATYEAFDASNWDFPTDAYDWNNLGAGGALQKGQAAMSSTKNKWQLAGFFGRLTYSLDEKYLFMASVRREGSSRFGINNQWGTFPAASVGWRISKERFMEGLTGVSEIKLRAGIGVTGTIASDPYLSQISYNFTRTEGAFIGGKWVPGFVPARNFNPDLRWEKKEEVNAGVDFGFLKNRINGSVDFYSRKVKDLLYDFPVPVPPYLIGSMLINAGTMKNEGMEVLLNIVPVQTANLQWNTGFTYSTNRNKLVSLSNDQFQAANDFFDDGYTGEPIQVSTHRVKVGEPIGRFFVWKSVGVDENGAWLVENKDGEVIPIANATPEDRQYYGNGIPKHNVGWNNSVRYKNFDLAVNMRGAFGFDILNFQSMFYNNPRNKAYNMLKTAYDPIDGKVLNNELVYVSNYIEKGDYWKIDNVTFGYTLPNLKGLKNARIFVSGLNLATITGYTGVDPEGVDMTGFFPGSDQRDKYPTTRTFTAGLSVTF